MKYTKTGMYSGQAIAIVMVILVVATVLGASLYSRTLKNKEAAINTKDSMMAVEQADSLLDLFVRADFSFLQTLSSQVQSSGESIEFNNTAELKQFLDGEGVDTTIISSVNNWCENTSNGSSLKLTISEAESTDFVDVRVGSARVFNLQGNTYTGGGDCNLTLMFEARDNAPTLFTIKEIYGNDSGEVAEYINDGSTDDMIAYCFKPGSSSCTQEDLEGIAAPSGSFKPLLSGNTLSITLNKTRGEYTLQQVRVIPLNLTLAVSHSIGNCSQKSKFAYMKVNAAVNCYGSFREKQIMVPGADSLGYSSLFDYTIYNIGTLRPGN